MKNFNDMHQKTWERVSPGKLYIVTQTSTYGKNINLDIVGRLFLCLDLLYFWDFKNQTKIRLSDFGKEYCLIEMGKDAVVELSPEDFFELI